MSLGRKSEDIKLPYTLNWSDDHTVILFSGQATYQELREIGPTHYGDSRFDDIRYVIVDFTHADLAHITWDKPTILASIDSTAVRYNLKLRLAFVVANENQRMLCEQYIEDSSRFCSSWSHQIFYNTEDAYKWCEIGG